VGDAAGIMGGDGQGHLVVADQDIGVVLDLLGVFGNPVDKHDGLVEILKAVGSLDLPVELSPFWEALELGVDLILAEFSKCLLCHRHLLHAVPLPDKNHTKRALPTPPVYTQLIVQDSTSHNSITRIAPSPTGALHLGNARTFLVNWAMARQQGWTVILRIEDLDTPRVKPGVIDQTIETLRWIGIDWDGDPIIQSNDLPHHRLAMEFLADHRLVYPCDLTRSQIESASSAPNEGDHETWFDPSLRPALIPSVFDDTGTNWRLKVDPGMVAFEDRFVGQQAHDPSKTVGDFVVWTRRKTPSYQLAVVVDDHRQGVTEIVRSDDLLNSTARQILLQRVLKYLPPPNYTHLPLVRGPDGRRLAKRHGDTRIDHYRTIGTSPEQIIGLLGHWCGISQTREKMSAMDFLAGFDLDRLPREDIVLTPEDDQWLSS